MVLAGNSQQVYYHYAILSYRSVATVVQVMNIRVDIAVVTYEDMTPNLEGQWYSSSLSDYSLQCRSSDL